MALVESEKRPGRGGKRKGAGRPRKAEEDLRVRFQVSCQPSERLILEEKARKAGLSLSRFMVLSALNA